MKEKLQSIKEQALSKIAEAQDINLLNDIKVSILGKKGELTQVLKSMKDVAPEDRPKVGQMVNETRANIEAKLEETDTDIQTRSRLKIWSVYLSVWDMRSYPDRKSNMTNTTLSF